MDKISITINGTMCDCDKLELLAKLKAFIDDCGSYKDCDASKFSVAEINYIQ